MEKPELIQIIGARLRAARRASGVTLSALHKEHGISQSQINHFELRGLPNITNLLRLCRIYGCTPGSIVDNLPE